MCTGNLEMLAKFLCAYMVTPTLGFFGELLMLVCQTFTMSDLVMLLHGQHQPLSRIQPQLSQFFTQNYLNGREPTDENIAVSTTRVSDVQIFCLLLVLCFNFSFFSLNLMSCRLQLAVLSTNWRSTSPRAL